MKSLKINTVSKLVKMTPDTIRYYEKQKIINPQRQQDNNYREFSLAEIRKLNDCRNFRNIGFSLEEINYLMKEGTQDELTHSYQKKKEEMEQQIKYLQIAITRLDNILESEEILKNTVGVYSIQKVKANICYWYGLNDNFNEEVIYHDVYSKVMDQQNLFKCTIRIPLSNTAQKLPQGYDYGLSMPLDEALKYEFHADPPAEIIPEQECINTIILVDGTLSIDNIRPILCWAKQHSFSVKDYIIGKVLNVSFHHGHETRIYEIAIPIFS